MVAAPVDLERRADRRRVAPPAPPEVLAHQRHRRGARRMVAGREAPPHDRTRADEIESEIYRRSFLEKDLFNAAVLAEAERVLG